MLRFLFFVVLVGLNLGCNFFRVDTAIAQVEPDPVTPIRLKVGVAGAPPFVIYGDKPTDPINGISLDVWRDI
ncbi:MAG: hypothetical protein VKL20_03790, partial [Synechocystis sp.]|nr:hypothetical protein [Synechocystis sp.]